MLTDAKSEFPACAPDRQSTLTQAAGSHLSAFDFRSATRELLHSTVQMMILRRVGCVRTATRSRRSSVGRAMLS